MVRWRIASTLFILQKTGNMLCQILCQGGVALAGQVNVVHGVELGTQILSIQEVNAAQVALFLIILGQLQGLFPAATAHGDTHGAFKHAFSDGGRCDHQNVGLRIAPALYRLGLLHQTAHGDGHTGGTGGETLLHIIGAQHDHQQIHELVALQAGIDVVQCA